MKAVVLVNLGSPSSPSVPHVRSYLKEFLSDPNVISIPWLPRFLLVYGIIAPIRSFRSSRLYRKLWREEGFPLITHSRELYRALKAELEPEVDAKAGAEPEPGAKMKLFLAMRYGEPSLKDLLRRLRSSEFEELLVVPLYPQFASSTTGSLISLVQKELEGSTLYDSTRLVPHFHQEEEFISLWQKKILQEDPAQYDAVVFSYHGVPVRQTEQSHPGKSCSELQCESVYGRENLHCYRSACFQTTRSVTSGLGLDPGRVHTAFQSRFGRNWLEPFTMDTLEEILRRGGSKVLVISPAFVADCLETEIEIGEEYCERFLHAGGENLTLVPSLNADPGWVEYLAGMIRDTTNNTIPLSMAHPLTGIRS